MRCCMYIRANAKINLGLNVKDNLPNGYHDLEMIMVPLNFYDELRIEIADQMSFKSNQTYVQVNPNNTIFTAITYLRDKYGFKENFKIELNKQIPTRAGLAGGSADGAATIKAVNALLNLKMSDTELKEAALAVGSDVYFCLINKPALVKGTGDIVEPFNCNCDFDILLVKPRSGVSTKESFSSLNLETCDHPDITAMQTALENNDYPAFLKTLGNSLEEPSFKLNRRILKVKKQLLNLGFDGALMSGSGSTVFGITKDQKILKDARETMLKHGYFTRIVRILK